MCRTQKMSYYKREDSILLKNDTPLSLAVANIIQEAFMQKEMHNKITRLLYELNALDKGSISLAEIAAEIGVSLRTVQRDMRDIQEAEFPLYCPNPGEYAFMEGFSLEKMKISDKEASLLILMHEVASSLGANFDDSYTLLKKRLLAEAKQTPFFIKFPPGETFPEGPVAQTISQCIQDKEEITLCYTGGRRTCYPVRPLKLAWIEGFWYLLALTNTQKLLKFRLNKISSVTAAGKFFPNSPDVENLIRQGTNIWFDINRPLKVVMEVSPQAAKYFQVRDYFPLQKTEEVLPNGGLVISCQAVNSQEVTPTILHWIPEIKVKEPLSLQTNIKNMLKKYLSDI